jgi:esterase/lipase superfamily enzyme
MKYDLGFPGAAILYSWPAPSNYVECEGNAIWTLPHLMEFLTQYVQQSGAQRIHLIAHSMGTRVLTTALKELAASPAAAQVQYDQIVLAAPDIDAAIFKRQIAPRIATAAERISIYSSSKDWALVASKKAHRYKRLGEGGENLTTFPEWPQIEVLDATNVDESLLGHSYYGDSPTILRDVRGVLAGLGAAARGLRAQADHYLFQTKRTQLSERPK